MNKVLKEKTELWMTLERKTLEQRKKAEQFYEEEMMEYIVKEYIRNNKGKLKEKAKYLIVSVGTSFEPIVLNISLLRPERILFLYTSQSEEILDKVMEFCGLKMSQIEKSKVNETNQTDIYREIKRCYLEWGKPEKIYIDFTGGTKAMSTAAAMAGAMIHVQMIYVQINICVILESLCLDRRLCFTLIVRWMYLAILRLIRHMHCLSSIIMQEQERNLERSKKRFQIR